jgi:hypothetical protein
MFRIQTSSYDSATTPTVAHSVPPGGPQTPPLHTPPPTMPDPSAAISEPSLSSANQTLGALTVNLPGATITNPYATTTSTSTLSSTSSAPANSLSSTMPGGAAPKAPASMGSGGGDGATIMATTSAGSSVGGKDQHPYRSFRVTMEDPCWKVLPAALKKYRVRFSRFNSLRRTRIVD